MSTYLQHWVFVVIEKKYNLKEHEMTIEPDIHREERLRAGFPRACHSESQIFASTSRPHIQRSASTGSIGHYSDGTKSDERRTSERLWNELAQKVSALIDGLPPGTLESGRACEGLINLQRFVQPRICLLLTYASARSANGHTWNKITRKSLNGRPPHSIYFRLEPITKELEVIIRIGNLGRGTDKKIHELLFVSEKFGARIVAVFRPCIKQFSSLHQTALHQGIIQTSTMPTSPLSISQLQKLTPFDLMMKKEIDVLEELYSAGVPHIAKIEAIPLRNKTHYTTTTGTCDLFTYLTGLMDKPIDETYYTQIHHFALRLLETLSAMHLRCKRVHHDLKLENILVSTTPSLSDLQLIDFASSVLVGTPNEGYVGSPGYIPPELLEWHRCTASTKTDMWTFGVILYIFLKFYNPFLQIQKSPEGIYEWGELFMTTLKGVRQELDKKGGEENWLLSRLLDETPKNRPEADEALSILGRLYDPNNKKETPHGQ